MGDAAEELDCGIRLEIDWRITIILLLLFGILFFSFWICSLLESGRKFML